VTTDAPALLSDEEYPALLHRLYEIQQDLIPEYREATRLKYEHEYAHGWRRRRHIRKILNATEDVIAALNALHTAIAWDHIDPVMRAAFEAWHAEQGLEFPREPPDVTAARERL
jgi:hypothetical protein